MLDSDLSVDSAYDRILRFNPDTAAFIDVFVEPGSLEDSIAFAFGPDGHVYVPDLKLEDTRSFNGTTGELQQVFSFADAPIESSVFDLVWGPDGSLYAATAERIIRFDGETGEFTNTFVDSVGGSIAFFPPAGPAADLSVAINNAPAGAFIDESVSITYTVHNNSANATSANQWVDVLYWSDDEIFDPLDTEIGRITHTSGLAAGESYSKTLTVDASDIIPGDYRILVFTDRRGEVADSNRLNNLSVAAAPTVVLPMVEEVDSARTLAVGRTLSSWTTSGMVVNELTITYTVYNLTSHHVTNVSLSTTLASGVALESASTAPVQNGQQLSWDVARLAPLGTFSVDVLVSFPGAIQFQLDFGSNVTGTVNFTDAVADSAPAARLCADPINPALLAATVDANSNDPFIRAKAAELNQNPDEIFAFLTQAVGYESYSGSLRGARGTLWSAAGNSLDEASLMIALLRASGVEAQYVHGPISDALAQDLIVSMFVDPLRVIGCIEPGTELADPANDPRLLAEVRDHYWVEFDSGAGFVVADPSFKNSTLGQSLGVTETRFNEIADALRHKVNFQLLVETASNFSGLLGLGLGNSVPLDVTVNAVELVGKPVSVQHFVDGHVLPSPTFLHRTVTYSPYLRIDEGGLPADDTILRDGSYQEILTNFPLSSQVVTGVFIEVELQWPEVNGQRQIETISKTLFDRIGFAARQGGQSSSLSVEPESQAIFTPYDVTTFSISAAAEPIELLQARAERSSATARRLQSALPLGLGGLGATQIANVQALNRLGAETASRMTAWQAANFAASSSELLSGVAETQFTTHYFDSPAVVAASSSLEIDTDPFVATTQYELDILRDTPRVHAAPYQVLEAQNEFHLIRGFMNSVVEGTVMDDLGAGAVSSLDVFTQATAANDRAILLATPSDLPYLDTIDISAEARARIAFSLGEGRGVLVPGGMVDIGGELTIAWLEIDPETGYFISVAENGAHAATAHQAAAYQASANEILALESAGIPFGSTAAGQSAANVAIPMLEQNALRLLGQYRGRRWAKKLAELALDQLIEHKREVNKFIDGYNFNLINFVHSKRISNVTKTAFNDLMQSKIFAYQKKLKDPPLPNSLLVPQLTELPDLLANAAGTGVATDIVHSPLWTHPFGGAQLPTVFLIGIKNLGPDDDVFRLSPVNVAPGFDVRFSLSEIRVPAGAIAEVGICLAPAGTLPAPGTEVSFGVRVESISRPGVDSSATETFVMPEVHGVLLTSDSVDLTALPGSPVTTTLTIEAVGNVIESVTFDIGLPDGLNLSGVMPTNVTPGQPVTQTLTLTSEIGVPLNTTLPLNLTANFGGLTDSPLTLLLRVAAPGAAAIAGASQAASELGKPELAQRLNELSIALNKVAESPGDMAAKRQALASLDSITSLLSVEPTLVVFVDPLAAVRNQLAAAMTPADCLAAISALAAALDDFSSKVLILARGNFDVSLTPNTQAAQPLAPREFHVMLHNVGTHTSTYNLAIAGLPPEVTAQFSNTQVTLVRDEFADIVLTLTQTTGDELLAFDFSVDVSIDGVAPTVTKSAIGSLRTRIEVVSVASVLVEPSFVDPGGSANVTARVLNAVNRQRDVTTSFVVKNSLGNTVFTSPNTSVSLGTVQSLVDVDLGSIDTSLLPVGEYTVTVSISEAGQPIPGATRDGRLLVGSPVTAELSASPDVLPPGDSTITNTLEISLGASTGGGSLELVGQLTIIDTGLRFGIAKRNDLLYVSGLDGTHIIDVTPPSAPTKVGFESGRADSMTVVGDQMFTISEGPSTNSPAFARGLLNSYSLTTGALFPPTSPTDPFFRDNLIVDYQFIGGPLVIGNTLFASQVLFRHASSNIFDTTGDVLSFDISNPFNLTQLDVLINSYGTTVDGDIRSGSPFHVFGLTQAGNNTLYAASTTSSIVNNVTTPGTGLVRIVDITTPANLQEAGSLAIPNTTFVTSITVEGNRAYLVGTQGGWKDPFVTLDDPGPSGNIVLTTLDLSNPNSPTIVGQTTLSRAARGAGGLVSVGGGRFAFTSLGELTDTPKLYVADFANPNAVQIVQEVNLTDIPRSYTVDGQFLYLSDSAGLKIFSLAGAGTAPVHAEVQIPNGAGIEIVTGSFNVPPTNIIDGVDFDTLVWDFNLTGGAPTKTITWQTNVTALQPGETRAVTLDSTINFTFQATASEISLPPETVVAEQVLGLSPASLTRRPGESAVFNLTIENPSGAGVTYDLSVAGVPQEWVDLESQVFVAAGGSVNLQLTLSSGPFTTLGEYGFVITATTGGVSGSVEGTLELAGDPFLAADFGVAKGVFAELIPGSATAGQGTAAKYVVRVTNTGSAVDQFVLFATGLPAGFATTFDSGIFDVPPGASNFREFQLTVVPPVGTTPGAYPFTVTAASVINVPMTGETEGSLTVLNLGVDVNISPASGTPNNVFQMVVTNTGQVTETFDLSVAAPSALVAMLGSTSVTLPPGASQTVPITVGAIDFAFPGALPIVGLARSRTNNAILDSDSADITIAGRLDMTAAFEKDVVELPAPGPASFLLLVENIGNLEDQYTAQIVGTTGPVTAILRDLDGLPTQSIPLFILPGLSTGAILLDSILTGLGTGTVTLQVKSLTDNSIVAQAVANVTSSQITTTTITSSNSGGSTYGQQVTFTATVSADTGTPTGFVQFQIDSVNSGSPVSLVGGLASFQTSLLSAGQHTISALYTSSTTDFVDSQGSFTQTVARAPLTITAADKTKLYGAALPPLTVSYAGFVNGETSANLTTQPNISTTATANSNVGAYPIVASGAASANYNISYVSGTLNVTKAPLTITADNKSKVSGDPLPAFTASYAGFVNNDTAGSLDTPATFSTIATANSPAGDYPINVSGATDANYNITFVSGNLHVTAPPTPTVGVDLLLTSTGSPASIVAGQGTVTYTFTVKNIGKLDGTGVKVSLASILPAGVTVKTISAPSGTSFSGSHGNGTWNVGKLKKNGYVTLCVTLTVGNSTAPGTNVIRSTATAIFADQGLINTTNDTTTQSTTVTTLADVAITKHTAPSSVAAGQNITYEVTVTNSGPGTAHNVSLVDMLPVGTTFVSQSQISGPAFVLTNTATQVTNSITTLAPYASAKFSIVARVAAAVPNNQKLTNKVTVSTASSDPKTSNNTSTATTTVVAPKADLSITKHTAPTSVQAGGVIAYTITVCNSGPTAASNVSLVDMLPAGTIFLKQTQTAGPGFVLNSSSNQVTNTIASLPSGVSATFTILVQVDGELPCDQELKNKVTVASSTLDPTTSNNSSTVTTKVFDSAASLHVSPSDPTKLDLVVTGSSKNDTIAVEPASGGKLSVKLNGKSLGSFSPTRNIVVYGRTGNDTVTVSSQVNRTAILFGGKGDDKLQTGAGSSVISGGDGTDNLIAGSGRNILIAGKGANTLNGKLGENVLLGGYTSYDAHQVALEKLLAEWSRNDADYSLRVQHLSGTPGGLNDSIVLNATTVFDNDSVDSLLAGSGADWFFEGAADLAPPLQPGEESVAI